MLNVLFALYIGDIFLLQHNNIHPPVAWIVQDYLEDIVIESVAWSANSPDLNPIKNVEIFSTEVYIRTITRL